MDQRIGGTKTWEGLQSRYLRNESRARGELAALRKGVSRSPGELPEIWELTEVPPPEHAGDAPTGEEIAVHTVMTFYAVQVPDRGLS